jgi:hypothetical protein
VSLAVTSPAPPSTGSRAFSPLLAIPLAVLLAPFLLAPLVSRLRAL